MDDSVHVEIEIVEFLTQNVSLLPRKEGRKRKVCKTHLAIRIRPRGINGYTLAINLLRLLLDNRRDDFRILLREPPEESRNTHGCSRGWMDGK